MYEPQQPPPPPGGATASAIAVTLKYHWMAFLLGLFKPRLHVNGQQVANAWGRQVIPVPPGQYHVNVYVPYFLPPRIGPADLGVNVYPGQTVELEYRAPTINFMKGALGTPPQKYPGMTVTIVIMVLSLLFLLCVCGGTFISTLNTNGS